MRREVRLKRVYEKPSRDDGLRVLVDGLWPRGVSRSEVDADLWLREVAPSPGLRRWFHHDVRRWQRFRHKYRAELARRPEALGILRDLRRRGRVTLLFAARDEAHNHAVVLREALDA